MKVIICPQCQCQMALEEYDYDILVNCPQCQTEIYVAKMNAQTQSAGKGFASGITDKVAETMHVSKLENFSLKKFFSKVFKKHTQDEIDEIFSCGSPSTTPDLRDVSTDFPTPWIWSRILFWGIIIFWGIGYTATHLDIQAVAPAYYIVGCAVTPLAIMVLFFELNVLKNVSLPIVIKIFAVGGMLSLIFTGLFHKLPFVKSLGDSMANSIAGLTEEPAKLLAAVAVANATKYRYKLNGMLFGAAVGAGFAVFETLGYVFLPLFAVFMLAGTGDTTAATEMVDGVEQTLLARGILAPFCHVIWTAIAGWALWRVKWDQKFRFNMLLDGKFLRIFCFPMILHMLWNAEWANKMGSMSLPLVGSITYIHMVIGAVVWTICFILVGDSLREIKDLKK